MRRCWRIAKRIAHVFLQWGRGGGLRGWGEKGSSIALGVGLNFLSPLRCVYLLQIGDFPISNGDMDLILRAGSLAITITYREGDMKIIMRFTAQNI